MNTSESGLYEHDTSLVMIVSLLSVLICGGGGGGGGGWGWGYIRRRI